MNSLATANTYDRQEIKTQFCIEIVSQAYSSVQSGVLGVTAVPSVWIRDGRETFVKPSIRSIARHQAFHKITDILTYTRELIYEHMIIEHGIIPLVIRHPVKRGTALVRLLLKSLCCAPSAPVFADTIEKVFNNIRK